MAFYKLTKQFDENLLQGQELTITAAHFRNQTIVQIRLEGQIDSTYEVTLEGISSLEHSLTRPLAGRQFLNENQGGVDVDEDIDSSHFIRDNLSDYKVVTKLGDPDDTQLTVISSQIAELYNSVIIPKFQPSHEMDNNGKFLISISSKIWKGDGSAAFQKLVFILQSIKEMYL
ncbi:Irc25p NDAI_0I02090 [Naumovozyma dairenensis CBS 421]|uniref:Proteasome chaperone 3 n=1 Tax=Naumovozyma dairenensis (strain ATCC 10597 / BCRC 20456 / CBS 421 / NBRC 0211 / NRRL Y-12639) TaxID=1071378 RepID=G0WG67_NAUDC|nr:hypothetical protein NDAI_0I02090 [Naumovozyma dairenensis CBS 421]CCD26778.1 hypothetical protein NDAI_0I02090 [Naumovozyma dairenensis CBS 421]